MTKPHALELAILTLLQAMPTCGYDLRAASPALGMPYYSEQHAHL